MLRITPAVQPFGGRLSNGRIFGSAKRHKNLERRNAERWIALANVCHRGARFVHTPVRALLAASTVGSSTRLGHPCSDADHNRAAAAKNSAVASSASSAEVCDRWRYSFENFPADMGERPSGRSINRINNDGELPLGNTLRTAMGLGISMPPAAAALCAQF